MDQVPAQTEQQTQEGQQAAAPGGEVPGWQKRIDELTAQKHSQNELMLKMQQQIAEQSAQMAQMAAQFSRPQPAPAAPAPDPFAAIADQMDPRQVDAFKAALQQTEARLKAESDARIAQMELQSSVYQLRSEAAAIPGIPPSVVQTAEQLVMNWRRQGIGPQTATAQDALNIALGQHQRAQLQRAAPVQQFQQQQAQQPYAPATLPSFAPPAPPAAQRPPNLDSLTPQQQQAYFDKAGVGDQPL